MDSMKGFKRVKIPFDKRVPISRISKEILLDSLGHVRAVVNDGIITIQMKKLSGNQKEFLRIDTSVSPPTIEINLEKPHT